MKLDRLRRGKHICTRSRQFLLIFAMRVWSLHTRMKLRVARKHARLTQNSRRGLLLRVLRGIKQHLWELRAELRVQRACTARLRCDLQESMFAWVNLWRMRKRRSLAIERVLTRKKWQGMRVFWGGWADHAARVWSVLVKRANAVRYVTRETTFNSWAQQAVLLRVTRQRFGKVLARQKYNLLLTHMRFWRLTMVEWSSFRLVSLFVSLSRVHSLSLARSLASLLCPCLLCEPGMEAVLKYDGLCMNSMRNMS